MFRRLLLLLPLLLAPLAAKAQEATPREAVPEPRALEPEAMVDALRPQRLLQRDAWRKTAAALRAKRTDPRAQLIGTWAMYHQFDIDFYWLVESDVDAVLDAYERDLRAWHTELTPLAERERVAKLAQYELTALLDDIAANRLQAQYDSANGEGKEALGKWFAEYADFQTQRAQTMQQRGRLIVELYRAGEVDSLRPVLALLERQIAERLLSDHLAEQAAHLGKTERDFAAQRKVLLAKQREEWKQLAQLLPEVKKNAALVELSGKVCELQELTLEVLLLRAAGANANEPMAQVSGGKEAELVKGLFARYQDLQRAASAAFFEKKLSIEEFARVHDLRMYTSLWQDKHLQVADVAADGIEVATQWTKAEETLQREQPGTIATAIATAKRLEAEITREERKPPPGEETTQPEPANTEATPAGPAGTPTEAKPKDGQPTEAKRAAP